MSDIGCRVVVNRARFADTADDLVNLVPTALADLTLDWGRASTLDQPEPATCRLSVLDRSGGASYLDLLPVGAALDVWASGPITVDPDTNLAVDGSFEGRPVGADAYPRVRWYYTSGDPPPSAIVVDDHTAEGSASIYAESWAEALRINVLRLPPAAFVSGDATAWDSIPHFGPGSTWRWSLKVRPGHGVRVGARPLYFTGPNHVGDWVTTASEYTPDGDGDWHTIENTVTNTATPMPAWLGVGLWVDQLAAWSDHATNWTETPDTWRDYGGFHIDDLRLSLVGETPTVTRDVLVFSGAITDLSAGVDDSSGTMRIEVTAIDRQGELEQIYIGDQPWPASLLGYRAYKILDRAGRYSGPDRFAVRYDAPIDSAEVTWRDVDNQPAGGLLRELAASVDGVLWYATHATTGPYLWWENPMLRVALARLSIDELGIVRLAGAVDGSNRPDGVTTLDGCRFDAMSLRWVYDITDQITRVDVTWHEQGFNDDGNPMTTERTDTVINVDAEERLRHPLRLGLATQLLSESDAVDVAEQILLRTGEPHWRVEDLEYDLGRFPPATSDEIGAALDLLDGTTRLGRGLVISDVEHWPAAGRGFTVGSDAHLDPGQGFATVQPPPLPNEFVITVKLRGPDQAGSSWIFIINHGFQLERLYPSGALRLLHHADGVSGTMYVNTRAPTGGDEWLAIAVTLDNGAGQRTYRSYVAPTDHGPWTLIETKSATAIVPDQPANRMNVGYGSALNRLYWAEARTGTTPGEGEIIWRFDAADATPGQTHFVDPRGLRWQVNYPSAIVAPVEASALMYLEGGSYRFDGAWRLALNTSPVLGRGTSLSWIEVAALWQWLQFDPTIAWLDLWGVSAGPEPTQRRNDRIEARRQEQ